MIFITKKQVLKTPTAGVDARNPLIGYDNIVVSGSVTADTTETGSSANNVTNDNLASFWRGNDTTAQNFTFVHPSDDAETNEIDYVGIARHNFGTARISVKIQGRDSSSSDFEDITSEIMPENDAPLFFWFDESSYQSVRVVMGSGVSAPQFSVLFIGKALQLQHSLEMPANHTQLKFARQSDILTGRTAANRLFIGRVSIGERYESSADLLMTPDFFRRNVDAFLQSAIKRPFFLSVFPQDYPDDVAFAWLLNDPQPITQLEIGIDRLRIEYAGIIN